MLGILIVIFKPVSEEDLIAKNKSMSSSVYPFSFCLTISSLTSFDLDTWLHILIVAFYTSTPLARCGPDQTVSYFSGRRFSLSS